MDRYAEGNNLETEECFDLDDTVTQENEVGEELTNVEENDDDLETLPHDQDHSHLVSKADQRTENDISLLNAKLTSLEVDLDTARNIVKGKAIELRSKNDEVVELQEKNLSLMRKNKQK